MGLHSLRNLMASLGRKGVQIFESKREGAGLFSEIRQNVESWIYRSCVPICFVVQNYL